MTGQPDTEPLETVYTVAEIAAALRVSRVTIGRLIAQKKLPALQVNNGFRIKKTDWNDYLASIEYRPAAPAVAAIP